MADKTINHFELSHTPAKEHLKALPSWTHDQAKVACQDLRNPTVQGLFFSSLPAPSPPFLLTLFIDLEELFLELIIKKVMNLMGLEKSSGSSSVSSFSFSSFKYKNSEDIEKYVVIFYLFLFYLFIFFLFFVLKSFVGLFH